MGSDDVVGRAAESRRATEGRRDVRHRAVPDGLLVDADVEATSIGP